MSMQAQPRIAGASAEGALVRAISTYQYALFGERESKGPIFLYGVEGELMGQVYFHPDAPEEPLPPAMKDESNVIDLHYRDSKFADVIDLLRNERDKLLIWTGGSTSRISTGI